MALSQRAAAKRIKELEAELANAWAAVRIADGTIADLRRHLDRAIADCADASDERDELEAAHDLLDQLPLEPPRTYSVPGTAEVKPFTLTARLVTWLAGKKF